MPRKQMEMDWPSGVIRRLGLRSTGARGVHPAPWAYNVRLEDSLTDRLRGGSFTGIASVAKSSPVYRDRAVTFSSNAITLARQGDSTDTALSSDISDQSRAVIIQLSEATATGSTVVAVIPHKDSFLVCFTATETWVLSGDPTTGGLRRVSDEVGAIGASAWCVNHDTIYFLSSLGIYSMGADGSGLSAVSEDKVPEDLTGISDTACVLTYNHADRGCYIHLTESPDWFYDTAREQFWPFDTSTTNSHVLLGPFQLGQGRHHGRLLNMHGTIASGSADVTWRLVIGDSAEEAAANAKAAIEAAVAGNNFSSYVDQSGCWSAGRAYMEYPRTRAIWCVLWLSSTGTWAYEGASLETIVSGGWK